LQKLGLLFSRFVAFIMKPLPWSLNRFMAWCLAVLWIDILRIRRQVMVDNIQKAFPHMPLNERIYIARKSMLALCRSFFDVMKIPSLTDRWIDDNVIFEGMDVIDKVRSESGGVFFLTLHLGSGDLGAAVVSRRIKPATIISKRFTNQFLDSFWFGLRERSLTTFINAHGKSNAFEILSALKKSRGVVFVLDQFMGKPYGVETQFFGITTGTAYGLALFVKKTHKPVYPIYTYWDENQKLRIHFDEAIDLSLFLSETNEVVTNKFNRYLESVITQHPQHWMWVHKRWKTFE
jgi:Kdo2-lipid IVA lauroyltransferase/acyltransferase